MLKKVVDFVEDHSGVVIAGVYAVVMGTGLVAYKKFLKDLAGN